MALKLLSRKLRITLHIALFFCFALLSAGSNAQSVLLPGDVVIVSANADTQSIDIIPLIDIEEGTELYFSSGVWQASDRTLTGSELSVTFLNKVEAGTNVHVNAIEDKNFEVSGSLNFEGSVNRLFSYQKAGEHYRHLFALGWGKGPIWNTADDDSLGSDVPETLLDDELYLTFGQEVNHQYFIRNGASGTRDLLLKFVSDEANWRSSQQPFPTFGTSFNLLKPPVILFEGSVSTVEEGDSAAVLNVSIYEHDGSRLTVDVVFDSSQSIITPNDINGFTSKTLNFTGLIGDAVYEVHVPIRDDDQYEGRETGIFTLQNLTKGNFGDFLNHSLVVNDNEAPQIEIASVLNNEAGISQIEVRNNENGVVALNGWELQSGEESYFFPRQTVIHPQESLILKDEADESENEETQNMVYADIESLLDDDGGDLKLLDYNDDVISEVSYGRIVTKQKAKASSSANNLIVNDEPNVKEEGSHSRTIVSSQVTMESMAMAGWEMIPYKKEYLEAFPEKEWLVWKEGETTFKTYTGESDLRDDDEILFGFFEPEEADVLNTLNESFSPADNDTDPETLSLKISATDVDENERINRLEGLNLVSNTLDEVISVQQLLAVLESEYPGIEVFPTVYGFERRKSGALRFIPLTQTDSIAPRAPFWLKLENVQEQKELQISQQQLATANEQELLSSAELTAQEDNRLVFEFSEADSDLKETMEIQIGDSESLENDLPDLNAHSELQLTDQLQFHVAIAAADEFYSKLQVSSELSTGKTLPISFMMNKNGNVRFSVTEWPQIPDEWEIRLEDRLLDKEYSLRDGFTLNFEHSPSNIGEGENNGQRQKEHRFLLHFTPPGAEKTEAKKEVTDTPRELELHQNFPNPFNPVTTISFYLPEPKEVKLSVFNIVGQPIAVIAEGTLSAGEKTFEWDARDRPSGMYIYQLEVGNKVMTRKMTLVK